MPRITSLEELSRLRVQLVMKRNQDAYRGAVCVTVGMATCGIAAGAQEVYRAVEEELKAHDLDDVQLAPTGCIGLCSHEPILEVLVGDAPRVAYGKVDRAMVKSIVQEHIFEGRVVEEFVIDLTPFPTI